MVSELAKNIAVFFICFIFMFFTFARVKSADKVPRIKSRKRFRKGFTWGVATAAYQIEGAWNISGKGPSIWDTLCHSDPSPVKNGDSGDVACDSYHLWKSDMYLLRKLKVNHYRFSIAWTRILPKGTIEGGINQAGIDYYQNFSGALIENGIEAMVTLYHWDLPQALQDKGGWMNPSSVDWFYDYAKLCFELFGSRVKYWITFNEPVEIAAAGYAGGCMAPKIRSCPGTCPYIVAHNIIRAHAKAWHGYDRLFRNRQNGKVGISLSSNHYIPGTNRNQDKAAADRALQFVLGWFAHPIFVNGDYPSVMKDLVLNRSLAEGLNQSRMPSFTPNEQKFIKGTHDFFGLNHYTSYLVYDKTDKQVTIQSYYADSEIYQNQSAEWEASGSSWLKSTPWAYEFDDVNVEGYTVWSLLDNFEWCSGYTQKFGINFVNFSDPERNRIPKMSAKYFASVISNNGPV